MILADLLIFGFLWFVFTDVSSLEAGLANNKDFVEITSGGFYAGVVWAIPLLHVAYALVTHTRWKKLGGRLVVISFFIFPLVAGLLGFPISAYYRSLPGNQGYELCSEEYENFMGYRYIWARSGVHCSN